MVKRYQICMVRRGANIDLEKFARGLANTRCADVILELLDALFTTEEDYILFEKFERIIPKLCRCSTEVKETMDALHEYYRAKGIWHDLMYSYGCAKE
jgi:hypothetical protein